MAKKTASAQSATPRSMTNGQVRTVTSERANVRCSFTRLAPGAASSSNGVGHHKAAARGVEVEQLRIAAPVDGGLHLALRFFFAELLVEHVEEELFGNGVVALGFKRAANLAQEQDVLERRVAEEFLLPKNFGVGELRSGLGDGCVAFLHFQEAEQLRRIDDGQQVVDLEGEIVGQAVDVVAAALVEQQFEQAGDAARSRMGQHLVLHLALVADRRPGC